MHSTPCRRYFRDCDTLTYNHEVPNPVFQRAESNEQSPYGQLSIAASELSCLHNKECTKHSFEATRYQIAGLENIDLKIVPPPVVRAADDTTIDAVVIDTALKEIICGLASETSVSGLLRAIQTASHPGDSIDDIIESAVSQCTHRAHTKFRHFLAYVPDYDARQAVKRAILKVLDEDKKGHSKETAPKPIESDALVRDFSGGDEDDDEGLIMAPAPMRSNREAAPSWQTTIDANYPGNGSAYIQTSSVAPMALTHPSYWEAVPNRDINIESISSIEACSPHPMSEADSLSPEVYQASAAHLDTDHFSYTDPWVSSTMMPPTPPVDPMLDNTIFCNIGKNDHMSFMAFPMLRSRNINTWGR